jgi:hypothetical protein
MIWKESSKLSPKLEGTENSASLSFIILRRGRGMGPRYYPFHRRR